jgi:serine beta-lactamase-like protein LACTB, mitochondrial
MSHDGQFSLFNRMWELRTFRGFQGLDNERERILAKKPAFQLFFEPMTRRLFLVVLSTLLSIPVLAQTPTDVTSSVNTMVNKSMQAQQIPAMTVAIGESGKITYSGAFGTADLENSVAANKETLIRTGSIAKPISAVAAMTLVEAGKLDLDAPVQKYCAPFPLKQWPITTRQLLSHTSGIRHYKENEIANTQHYQFMSDGFAIFANDPLLFEPGTKYSYSTYGYTVVGCVIEGASGQNFGNYVAQHVFKPAGMTHTFVDDAYEIVPHRARGYQKMDKKVKNAGLMDSSYKIPGGGFVTTAEDLVLFSQALMDGKIVKASTLDLMWTPAKLKDGSSTTYGLGFGVSMPEGEKYVAHNGGQQGTSTAMVLLPGKHFSAAALANMDDVDPSEVIRGILDLYKLPYPKKGEKK